MIVINLVSHQLQYKYDKTNSYHIVYTKYFYNN